jgi:phenylacetic acid degradation operon negative regulatory protein
VAGSPNWGLAELRRVTCSDGAPSARNLLVTVFGDALLPHGEDTSISVGALASLLASFGVNDRLVRTSLTRLVNEGLLTTTAAGRRSFYRVADSARELFQQADERIYGVAHGDWDGSWTIVVIDGSEATPGRRAQLRQELAWAGLGSVAPNVMASPIVAPEVAARVVEHVGGFANVLVSRSKIVEAAVTIGADQLAHRVAALDEIGTRYGAFVERFGSVDVEPIARSPEDSFKLRTLIVAEFRRIALADPQLPPQLLPEDWIGSRARRLAATTYDAVAAPSERFLVATSDPPLARVGDLAGRFDGNGDRRGP